MEMQFSRLDQYDPTNLCMSNFEYISGTSDILTKIYSIGYTSGINANGDNYANDPQSENMCPRDYNLSVDTSSWGMCSCWENGGRRSKNGKSAKCLTAIPIESGTNDSLCTHIMLDTNPTFDLVNDDTAWCIRDLTSSLNQVCPIGTTQIKTREQCDTAINTNHKSLPEGRTM